MCRAQEFEQYEARFRRRTLKLSIAWLMAVACIFALIISGCAPKTKTLADGSIVNTTFKERLIYDAQKTLAAVKWLKPISDAVMAGVCMSASNPEMLAGCSIYRAGSMGAGMLTGLVENLISQAEDKPGVVDLTALTAATAALKDSLVPLDAGFKGKASILVTPPVPAEVVK